MSTSLKAGLSFHPFFIAGRSIEAMIKSNGNLPRVFGSAKWQFLLALALTLLSTALAKVAPLRRVPITTAPITSPRLSIIRHGGLEDFTLFDEEAGQCSDEANSSRSGLDCKVEKKGSSIGTSDSDHHDDLTEVPIVKRTGFQAVEELENGSSALTTRQSQVAGASLERKDGSSSSISGKKRPHTTYNYKLSDRIKEITTLLPKNRASTKKSVTVHNVGETDQAFHLHLDRNAEPVVFHIDSQETPKQNRKSREFYTRAKARAEEQGEAALAAFKEYYAKKAAARYKTMTVDERQNHNQYSHLLRKWKDAKLDREDPARSEEKKARRKELRKIAARKLREKRAREFEALEDSEAGPNEVSTVLQEPSAKKAKFDLNIVPINSDAEGEEFRMIKRAGEMQESTSRPSQIPVASSSPNPASLKKRPQHARMPELSAYLHKIADLLPKDRKLDPDTIVLHDGGEKGLEFHIQVDKNSSPIIFKVPPRKIQKRIRKPGQMPAYQVEKKRAEEEGEAGMVAFRAKYKARQAGKFKSKTKVQRRIRGRYNHLMKLVNQSELAREDPSAAAEKKMQTKAVNDASVLKSRGKRKLESSNERSQFATFEAGPSKDSSVLEDQSDTAAKGATFDLNEMSKESLDENEGEEMHLFKRTSTSQEGSSSAPGVIRRAPRGMAARLLPLISKTYKRGKLPRGAIAIQDLGEQSHTLQVRINVEGNEGPETIQFAKSKPEKKTDHYQNRIKRLKSRGTEALAVYREKEKVRRKNYNNRLTPEQRRDRNRANHVGRLISLAKMDPKEAREAKLKKNLSNKKSKQAWNARQNELKQGKSMSYGLQNPEAELRQDSIEQLKSDEPTANKFVLDLNEIPVDSDEEIEDMHLVKRGGEKSLHPFKERSEASRESRNGISRYTAAQLYQIRLDEITKVESDSD